MAKSVKLKNDTYLDSTSVVNGHTDLSSYCWWVDNWILSSQQIWVNHSTGFNITVGFPADKIPIIVLGADNNSNEPIFIMIHANRDYGAIGVKQLSGSNVAVSNNGNVYHIAASKYSYYWVIVPPRASITLATGSL